jgi:hypothetical protein
VSDASALWGIIERLNFCLVIQTTGGSAAKAKAAAAKPKSAAKKSATKPSSKVATKPASKGSPKKVSWRNDDATQRS